MELVSLQHISSPFHHFHLNPFNETYLLWPLFTVKFVVPWAEVIRLERVSGGFMTEAIRVSTRQRQRDFSMFLNLDEAFGVVGQLADIALRRLLDSEGLELDRVLQQPARITKRSDFRIYLDMLQIWER